MSGPLRRFEDAVVIVSGGARGMGESHVRAFVAEGAFAIIGDLLEEPGRALADELGDRAEFVRLDVADEDDWAAVIAAAERHGQTSVLVNNAGLGPTGTSLVDYALADWRRMIDVNLIGAFLGTRAVAPVMRRGGGGSIVNIASVMGMMGGGTGRTAYTASKWGLRGFTKSAAIELGPDNIRVNAVLPGPVETPMIQAARDASGVASAAHLPIPRTGRPEELSKLVLFLASDDASYCTGADFVADGGMTSGPVGGLTDTAPPAS